ncbi:MAG: ribosome small subunit-dependent GTPase A [Pseudomonadota bacterium]
MTRFTSRPSSKRSRPVSPTAVASDDTEGLPGLVISNFGAALEIEDATGHVHRCTARKKAGALVCGDRVRWQATNSNEGVILALQPRTSLLVRPDPRGQLKPMAANVDQLLVVTAPRHRPAHGDTASSENDQVLDEQLIDRYLAAAALCHIDALILINKADLFNDDGHAAAEQVAALYRGIGYPVRFTAAKKQQGLESLTQALRNKTSVIIGQSGVGKSSLALALHPGQEIRVGAVSANSGEGRHTTTTAALYHLPGGGDLIDSPGVRDFGLWHVDTAELAEGFLEFGRYAGLCRFNNCTHRSEPGCAVDMAAGNGEISPRRLASYRRIAAAMQT